MDAADAFRNRMGAVAAVLVVIGVMMVGVYSLLHPLPPISASYADGTYQNDDCGTLELRSGAIHFRSSSVSYTLERQKHGVSAVTPHFLGVEIDRAGCHVVYDPSSYPLFLSFGRNIPPQSVSLKQVGHDSVYVFYRLNNRIAGVDRPAQRP
ncbi:hypothetical protein [Sphingomonas sp. PvP055]|uniref:hypothetical protein n=1 Tax=Sphingomonas sp. PvP055 TaxID=3156391 RepID=UPI0033933F02